MEIGIIGSGNIGGVLVRHLTALGHKVSIANSRGPESLADLAHETGATAATVEEAARAKDVVVVTIPEAAVPKLPQGLLASTSAVVVDTGNYYPLRDGDLTEIQNGLTESEWVAKTLGHPVVKAFNNIYSDSLDKRGVPAGTAGRVCLPVAGDDEKAKAVVLALVEELGFDALDAGSLKDSWRQQPGTPVYTHDFDRKGVEAALVQADADKLPEYRAAANEAARAFFG